MSGETRVAGGEVGQREGEGFRYELLLLVLIDELLLRPIEIDLRIAVKREP